MSSTGSASYPTNSCTLDDPLSFLHTFNEILVKPYHHELCVNSEYIGNVISFVILQVMHIPVFLLIVITLFGKENEDSKWFVFHTAVLNLILGVIWEIWYIYLDSENSAMLTTMVNFALNLAVNSIFPLAFTRFLCLYFEDYYKKIFKRKLLFPIFLAYDLFMLTLFYIDSLEDDNMIMLIIDLLLLIGNLLCSTCVFLKIRSMMKLVDSSSQFSTLNDLKRAAFVVTFQSCLVSIHLATTFFVSLFQISLRFDENLFNSLFELYIISAQAQFPLYQIIVIFDTFVILFVLRSYRTAMMKIYKKCEESLKHMLHFMFVRKCTKTRVIHMP